MNTFNMVIDDIRSQLSAILHSIMGWIVVSIVGASCFALLVYLTDSATKVTS